MGAELHIYEDDDGFRWRLWSAMGTEVASSEPYKRKGNATRAAEKLELTDTPIVDLTESEAA